MSMDECRAFLTGSRRYGTPTEDSDTDLVILCEDFVPDRRLVVPVIWNLREKTAPSCRFGKLNIITFTIRENFLRWRQVTEELEKRKPVTRDEAIAAFQAAGFKGYGEKSKEEATNDQAKE